VHYDPTPHDRPAPDADAAGYDPRAHFAPPPRVVRYVVFRDEQAVSKEYDTFSEAMLYLLFDTPGTEAYAVRPVTASPRSTP